MTDRDKLVAMRACQSALDWIGDRTIEQAWSECGRNDGGAGTPPRHRSRHVAGPGPGAGRLRRELRWSCPFVPHGPIGSEHRIMS